MPTIAPGVIVADRYVGGLTSEPARAAVAARFDRKFAVVHGTHRWWVAPRRFGAGATIDLAVARALAAPPRTKIALEVRWSPQKVAQFAAEVARTVDRAAVDSELVSVSSAGPEFTESRDGLAVARDVLVRRIERNLARNVRTPVLAPTRPVPATTTASTFGRVIWIDRTSNTLRLYDGVTFVQSFGVATGQSQYPTPSGMWHIVNMQRDPWWYPPDSPWAKGEKPVPPGPGNPLGTRWMGLDAAGVGIHGTPDAASIGYSASHGCIRMQIPDAEWLFDHVSVGTPVYIT